MMRKQSIQASIQDITRCFNQEYGQTFPLDERELNQKWVASHLLLPACSVALYEEQDFLGAMVVKKNLFQAEKLDLAFLYIDPHARRQGYATLLLNELFAYAKVHQYKKIQVGGDFEYVFSGIPIMSQDTETFFQKKGFTLCSDHVNLITDIAPKESNLAFDFHARSLQSENEKQAMLSFIKQHFSPRWVEEVRLADLFDCYGLFQEETIVGFIRIGDLNSTNLPNSLNYHRLYPALSGMGPLGIHPELRKKGIGKAFVQSAINHLFARGASHVMVDWTNLIDFYQACGFHQIFATFHQYSISFLEEEYGS